jgi:hypothetical protein
MYLLVYSTITNKLEHAPLKFYRVQRLHNHAARQHNLPMQEQPPRLARCCPDGEQHSVQNIILAALHHPINPRRPIATLHARFTVLLDTRFPVPLDARLYIPHKKGRYSLLLSNLPTPGL